MWNTAAVAVAGLEPHKSCSVVRGWIAKFGNPGPEPAVGDVGAVGAGSGLLVADLAASANPRPPQGQVLTNTNGNFQTQHKLNNTEKPSTNKKRKQNTKNAKQTKDNPANTKNAANSL